MIKMKKNNKAWTQDALPTVKDITDFDRALGNFYIMKKMRERFGEKPYNAEHLFPDPRKQWPPKRPVRLKRSLPKKLSR